MGTRSSMIDYDESFDIIIYAIPPRNRSEHLKVETVYRCYDQEVRKENPLDLMKHSSLAEFPFDKDTQKDIRDLLRSYAITQGMQAKVSSEKLSYPLDGTRYYLEHE